MATPSADITREQQGLAPIIFSESVAESISFSGRGYSAGTTCAAFVVLQDKSKRETNRIVSKNLAHTRACDASCDKREPGNSQLIREK
jgi:hypothetical protein